MLIKFLHNSSWSNRSIISTFIWGGTRENHDHLISGLFVSRPRFELSNYNIEVYSVTIRPDSSIVQSSRTLIHLQATKIHRGNKIYIHNFS
jgi:hypothetical protein